MGKLNIKQRFAKRKKSEAINPKKFLFGFLLDL